MHKQLVAPDRLSVWFSAQRLKALLSVGLRHFLFATLLGSFALTGLFFSMQALGQGWQTAQPFEGIAFALMSGDRSRLNSPGGGCGSLDGGTVSGSESGGPSTDLEVTKFVDNPTPREGDTIVYTIFLANLGPDDATRIRVRDVLPAGVTYVGDIPSRGDYNPDNGLWSLNNLVYCDSATLTISATVNNGTAGEIITNTASYVSADPPDPNPGNNVGEAVIKVQLPAGADLAITKTVNISHPNAGDTITYTVTVINNGPDDATGVQISDTLPISLSFSKYMATQGVYTGGFWTVGNLGNTATATLMIEAKVNTDTVGQVITNTARITLVDQIDPITNNNESTVVINVTPVVSHLIHLPIIYKAPPPPCHVETFSDNAPDIDWHIPPPPPGTIRRYINDEYRLFSQTKEGVHWSRSPMGSFTEYLIEVEAHWGNNKYIGSEYGLIFDRSGKNDETAKMYRFNINTANRTYILGRLLNGRWEYGGLPSGYSADIRNSPKEVNILKVIRRGDIIKLYINGKYQDFYDDDNKLNNRPARVGVNVVPVQKVRDGDARFDNFKICSYELSYNNSVSTNGVKESLSGGVALAP